MRTTPLAASILLGLLLSTGAAAQVQSLNISHDTTQIRVELRFQGDWQWHRVYVDTDNNRSTGFRPASISVGAEVLLEGTRAYRYTGNGSTWSWTLIAAMPGQLLAGSWSMTVPRSALGPTTSTLALHANVERGQGQHDFGPSRYTLSAAIPPPTAPPQPPTPPVPPVPPLPPTAPVPPAPVVQTQQLGLPAYIWAGDTATWNRVLATAPADLDTLIINPANGPATARDGRVATHVQAARTQGRRVLGYVWTDRGRRPIEQIRLDIDRYFAWYGINGIFLDEVAVDCSTLGYYSALRDHIRSKHFDVQVINNPGGVFPECLMPTADVWMSFETHLNTYLGTPIAWVRPSFADRYPRERFWHVVHSVPQSRISEVVSRSRQLHVGRLWITDDVLANPYDSFPSASYFNALRSAARQ